MENFSIIFSIKKIKMIIKKASFSVQKRIKEEQKRTKPWSEENAERSLTAHMRVTKMPPTTLLARVTN